MLIETFADLVCPWCYIGSHRLERAMTERPKLLAEGALKTRWQPFQLNPDLPRSGVDRNAYLVTKFGGAERARQVHAVVEETAERDGLPLALDRIRRTPNTFDAHRLIRIAGHRGLDRPMASALFRAYFAEGLDIGDRDTLTATAVAVGLDGGEVRALLAGDAEASCVQSADTLARHLGLQAVPCYIFNRRYALSGAQEPASFLPLLDLAVEESEDAMLTAMAD